jgi:hypothetical protein
MKNGVFWDIRTKFVLHRRHITVPLQSPAGKSYVRFEVFTAVVMKDALFWDVTRAALVRTCFSWKRIASIFRVKRIEELRATSA